MKRFFFVTLTCAGILGMSIMSSCKKDDDVSSKDQTMDSLIGKATITGVVLIDNDQTQKISKNEVATDAIVTVSYETKDLAYKPDSNAISYTKTITTKTDATGKFSITVEANDKGISYTVEAAQYATKYSVKDVDDNNEPIIVTKDCYFRSVRLPITIKKGETQYVQLNYGKTPQYVIE